MNILYVSYDGILEPLGESQVLAYIQRLSQLNHKIYLVSFEKKDDLKDKIRIVRFETRLKDHNILWTRLSYTKSPPIFSTIFDLIMMFYSSLKISKTKNIQVIHCRSYLPSLVGLLLKKLIKIRFIFDMRGFWADEKVDSAQWSSNGLLYKFFKYFEKYFIESSDHIVSLTKNAISEINKIVNRDLTYKISVIPTCTDINQFSIGRENLHKECLTLGYLGNISNWYLFDEIIDFFRVALTQFDDINLLIVNKEHQLLIKNALKMQNISSTRFKILSSNHEDIHNIIRTFDFSVFFIKPSFAKKASCPTKLGELLASGVPCITNSGVGDVDHIISQSNSGIILYELNRGNYEEAINLMKNNYLNDPNIQNRCRETAIKYFSLDPAVDQYNKIYNSLK